MLQALKSELTLGYLNDVSIGGKISTVIDDFDQLQAMATDLGLQLNKQKCEATVTKNSPPLPQEFSEFIPVESSKGELLGGALFAGTRLDEILPAMIIELRKDADRLHLLQSHDALLILGMHSVLLSCCTSSDVHHALAAPILTSLMILYVSLYPRLPTAILMM